MATYTSRKHFNLPLKTIAEVAPITPKKCTYGGLLGSVIFKENSVKKNYVFIKLL